MRSRMAAAKRPQHPPGPAAPDTAAGADSHGDFAAELDRVLASAAFKSSRRHRRLLDYLVRHTLDGREAALKESVLAAEVFERSMSTFDPVHDTIVRVEARRLRQRLQQYYVGEGQNALVQIGLPVGSYVPTLQRREDATAQRAGSLQVNDLVERGYHFMRQADEVGIRKGLERFEAALRLEPDHAGAYLGAARAWLNLVSALLVAPLPWVEHATEALRRSLELDPQQPDALTLLGSMLHRYEFDWKAAEQHLRRAVDMAPQRAFTHSGYGFHLMLAGRYEDAQRQLKVVRDLDPHFLNGRLQMAMLRIAQERYDDADKELDAVLDLSPADMPARAMAAAIRLNRGDPASALERYRTLDLEAPHQSVGLTGMAQSLAMLGRRDETIAALATLRERFTQRYVSPYQVALVHWRLGDADQTLKCLDDAAASRDPNLIFAPTDPAFAGLRGQARFDSLLQRHRRATI